MNHMAAAIKIRVGDLLIKQGDITQEQLDQALAEQKKTGMRLGQTLVTLGFIAEEKLLKILSEQLNLPIIELSQVKIEPEVTKKIPETIARRFRAIAVSEKDGLLNVGIVDPTDLYANDEIARIAKMPVEFSIVKEADLLEALDLVYRRTDEIIDYAGQLDEELTETDISITTLETAASGEDAIVVKLMTSLFEDAVQIHASDIHIEPAENFLRIRQRVDGILQENIVKEKRIATALTQRIKLMSNLNITEKRLPQDGRFNLKVKNKNIDVRVSTMPTTHGESVVMRLLDQSIAISELSKIGIPADMEKELMQLIALPHGMLLVTGPTGSGKTTTLYSAHRH